MATETEMVRIDHAAGNVTGDPVIGSRRNIFDGSKLVTFEGRQVTSAAMKFFGGDRGFILRDQSGGEFQVEAGALLEVKQIPSKLIFD